MVLTPIGSGITLKYQNMWIDSQKIILKNIVKSLSTDILISSNQTEEQTMKTNTRTTEVIQRSLHVSYENMHGNVLTDFLAAVALLLLTYAFVIGMCIIFGG